jgi:phosphatidylglycerol lysyltransferase
MPDQLANIHWAAWIAAFTLTALSLWTVGRYDGVAHKHFATRVQQNQARAAGTISIALAQTLGAGVFTGALARWRMLHDVSFVASLKLSAFVSISFMFCWAVFTAICCLVFPAPNWTFIPSILIICATPLILLSTLRWPVIRLSGQQFRFPNLQSNAAILFWTAIDTCAVAGAMYVLLPSGADIQYSVFLPLFLLALGTALLSNTPGGVGPFELMMLTLLPQLPAVEVLGSIIAFRVVYYAVPAFGAIFALMRPFRNDGINDNVHIIPHDVPPQAEVQIIAQNGGRLLATDGGSCAVWPTSQTLTALCNPLSGSMLETLNAVCKEATVLGKYPFVYKCCRKNAVQLRKKHWSMIHMSDDAIILPQTFTLEQPALRTLRRKLRVAQKSGLTIKTDTAYPWLDMQRVDTEWQATHGTARGGTMGRFEVAYLANHFIARAECQGKLCAFVTFQIGTDEWCLDVMRHTDTVPDGTMHTLVHTAILAAQRAGVTRISLASTPACPDPNSRFFRWAARQAVVKAGGTGLRQFKSSFAPQWEPRYAAAQSWLALVIGLADITREVHHPNPLTRSNQHEIHNLDEYYELASKQAS